MNNEFIMPNYYAIIPASVRYDTKITANEKLLYAEITALCNIGGKCFASNEYFSILYNVSIRSIQLWLKNLRENNYIKIIFDSKNKEKRFIQIVEQPTKAIKDKMPNTNNNFEIDEELQNFMKKIGLKK